MVLSSCGCFQWLIEVQQLGWDFNSNILLADLKRLFLIPFWRRGTGLGPFPRGEEAAVAAQLLCWSTPPEVHAWLLEGCLPQVSPGVCSVGFFLPTFYSSVASRQRFPASRFQLPSNFSEAKTHLKALQMLLSSSIFAGVFFFLQFWELGQSLLFSGRVCGLDKLVWNVETQECEDCWANSGILPHASMIFGGERSLEFFGRH